MGSAISTPSKPNTAPDPQTAAMATGKIITSTPRLDIVELDPENASHCAFLIALWNTPLFFVHCGKTGINTMDKAKAMIEGRFMKEYKRNGYGSYFVVWKESNTFVGSIALTKGDSAESYLAPDLGFVTLPEMTGKGIATEAGKALIEYAEQELGVKAVFGFCDPTNLASRKVLQRVGLEFCGVKKLAAFGGKEDAVYAMPHMKDDLAMYGLTE